MAYDNLLAEMRRRHKTQKDLSVLLGKSISTTNYILNQKTKLTYDGAIKIHDSWFPELPMEYLFQGGKS